MTATFQGAEFFGGFILAAANDETQAVYQISPADGSVEKIFDRNLKNSAKARV